MRLVADYGKTGIKTAAARLEKDLKTRLTRATAKATLRAQADTRAETKPLGSRLQNAWRARVYPESAVSDSPAGEVRTNAPHIIKAFTEGSTIRGRDGLWLAIPLPAAGKYQGGAKRMTPELFELQTGLRLRFVYLPGRRKALLVADQNAALGRGGIARRRFKGIGRERTAAKVAIPIFVLVPQVKMPKRLDLRRIYANARRFLREELTREFPGA